MKLGIVAGETSSDFLGGELLRRLKESGHDIEAVGVGGEHLAAAGMQKLADISQLSVMGALSAASYLRLSALQKRIARQLLQHKIDAFIGVDSSSFNLPIARKLRRKGVRTAQYGSPSVWAWRRWRLRNMRKAVDQVFCLFPFELWPYEETPVNASCVGHPVATRARFALIEQQRQPEQALATKRRLGLPESDSQGKVVVLLPGSRQQELDQHAGFFSSIADSLERHGHRPVHAPPKGMTYHPDKGQVMAGEMLPLLSIASAAVVCSGTASLETALYKVPQLVVYRTQWLHRAMIRLLADKNANIALPNLLLGTRLIPEFFQPASSRELSEITLQLLDNPERQRQALALLQKVLLDHQDLETAVSNWLRLE